MCTMALLHRALAASKAAAGSNGNSRAAAAAAAPAAAPPAEQQAGPEGDGAMHTSDAAQAMGLAEEAAAHEDARMPCRLVAMAGVYDIAKHFEYEEGEQVLRFAGWACIACSPGCRCCERSPVMGGRAANTQSRQWPQSCASIQAALYFPAEASGWPDLGLTCYPSATLSPLQRSPPRAQAVDNGTGHRRTGALPTPVAGCHPGQCTAVRGRARWWRWFDTARQWPEALHVA